MSRRTFIGGAAPQQQIQRATPGGTIESTDKFIVTLTDESGTAVSLSTAAGGTTVAAVTAAVSTAFNASVDPRFVLVAATDMTTYIKFAAKTTGISFHMTVSTTESDDSAADGQTFTTAVDQANGHPEDANCPANYAEGIAPVASDDVTIQSGTISQGLVQTAVWTGNLTTALGSTVPVGSPARRLKVTPSSFINLGKGLTFIDLSSAAITPRVVNTAPAQSGQPGLDIIGSALTGLRVEGGSVGVAVRAGETATIGTVELYNGALTLGPGVTLTNWHQSGGAGELGSAGGGAVASTATFDGGTAAIVGSGTVGTLTNDGGTVFCNTSGTVSTFVQKAGKTDFTKSRTARTVSSTTFSGGEIMADTSVMTFSTFTPSGSLRLIAKAA